LGGKLPSALANRLGIRRCDEVHRRHPRWLWQPLRSSSIAGDQELWRPTLPSQQGNVDEEVGPTHRPLRQSAFRRCTDKLPAPSPPLAGVLTSTSVAQSRLKAIRA
jgi:hypothetical protein